MVKRGVVHTGQERDFGLIANNWSCAHNGYHLNFFVRFFFLGGEGKILSIFTPTVLFHSKHHVSHTQPLPLFAQFSSVGLWGSSCYCRGEVTYLVILYHLTLVYHVNLVFSDTLFQGNVILPLLKHLEVDKFEGLFESDWMCAAEKTRQTLTSLQRGGTCQGSW